MEIYSKKKVSPVYPQKYLNSVTATQILGVLYNGEAEGSATCTNTKFEPSAGRARAPSCFTEPETHENTEIALLSACNRNLVAVQAHQQA